MLSFSSVFLFAVVSSLAGIGYSALQCRKHITLLFQTQGVFFVFLTCAE